MKKVLKISVILLIVVSILIPIKKIKATEELDANIELECTDKIQAGQIITLNIKMSNLQQSVDTMVATIEYDKNIFEELTDDDIKPGDNWNYPLYNQENGSFMIDRTEGTTESEQILSIELKVKENVTDKNTDIKLTNIEIAGLGKDLYANKEINITAGEKIEEVKEDLYISTKAYKIGNVDISKYEKGDKYISGVTKETKLKDYINNLTTNGEIKVTKDDGTELKEEEYVGTGMKMTVTKDEEVIELIIAVLGDLDGNGKVTATDLSTINQTVLKLITLENEYKLAGDLDENDKITATDLSTINQMVLKIL